MIFKKTRSTTSLKRAVIWLDTYADEVTKHDGKKPAEGLQEGKNFSTTRPAGTVSAHGYAKDRVSMIKMLHGVSGKDAIKMFMGDYARRLKSKRRKILGLRAIFSLRKDIIAPAFDQQVDIDQKVIACVEKTADLLSNTYYAGQQLGYFIGMHHDRDHIHGHLFLLPYTDQDKRICFSNWPRRGPANLPHEQERPMILDMWIKAYADIVQQDIYRPIEANKKLKEQGIDPRKSATPPASREQRIQQAMALLCAQEALNKTFETKEINNLENRRKHVLARFLFNYLQGKRSTFQYQYAATKAVNKPELKEQIQTVSGYLEDRRKHETTTSESRVREIQKVIDQYRSNIGKRSEALDVVSPKLIADLNFTPANRVAELSAFYNAVRSARKSKRITSLAHHLLGGMLRYGLTRKLGEDLQLIEEVIAADPVVTYPGLGDMEYQKSILDMPALVQPEPIPETTPPQTKDVKPEQKDAPAVLKDPGFSL